MAILNRKLFNRGGPVSSRGVGITSGLVPRYKHGGSISEHTTKEKFVDNMEMLKGLNLFQPQTFDAKENMTPYLLDLSARLLGGTSKRGGIGGALEIGGQAVGGANPLLSKALQNKREFEATDQEAPLKQMALQMALEKGEKPQYTRVKPGESLYKDGELVVEKIMPEKNQQLIKLNPNQILIDPITKQEVARGMVNADTDFFKLNPGQKIFDKNNKVIAFYEDTDDAVIKLNPGQKAFDKDGNLLFESPALAKEGKIFKLNPGQKAFDANGQEIASGAPKEIKLNPGQKAFDANGNLLFESPALAKEEKTFKLSQGQKAFDAAGNEIASVAPKETRPIDTSITVSAGSKVINKETGEVIFDNPSNQDQTKIYKAQPGSTLVNEAGEVIYKAPEKKEYFKLKEGESIYNQKGEVIATGTSTVANIDTYRDFATAEERQQFLVNTLSKKAGFDTDGRVMIENLPFDEQQRLELAMQSVDLIYKQQVENWGDTQKEYLATISDVYTLETQLDQAEENLMNETELVATGPVTGRITPLFGVFENLTGLSLPTIFNNVLGKNVLLTTLQKDEINRLQNQIAISFQKQMKGQVNTFEAKQIVQSMFNVNKLPGSNKVAIDNMRFINDMNKAMIDISQNSKTYAEFSRGVQQWKKDNKLPQLIPETEKKQNIKDEYGLTDEEAGITG